MDMHTIHDLFSTHKGNHVTVFRFPPTSSAREDVFLVP